jgi:phosphoribosyl 1,2-cyclic phosphodiesterase
VKVALWGTRGSLPTAGPDTARYGGNTACVEIRGDDGTFLVLDAGTGIRPLGAALEQTPSRVDILLTHLHMDHIQGLGFFQPLFETGLEVHIWGPTSGKLDLRARLTRYLSPPLFPVPLRDLPSDVTLHEVSSSDFRIGSLNITADHVCHPGPTFGYRIQEGSASVAYLPDHEPALGLDVFPPANGWMSGFDLAADVDLLIHDAQYTPEEYERHVGWGHSSIAHCAAFATAARAKQLVLFHHDPSHDDASLDMWAEQAAGFSNAEVEVTVGSEGAVFQL